MKICKLKIDNKGRIQFPKTFLDANNIPFGSIGFMEVIASNHNAVRFPFIEPTKKETDGQTNIYTSSDDIVIENKVGTTVTYSVAAFIFQGN